MEADISVNMLTNFDVMFVEVSYASSYFNNQFFNELVLLLLSPYEL